jgi:hypothetical protein
MTQANNGSTIRVHVTRPQNGMSMPKVIHLLALIGLSAIVSGCETVDAAMNYFDELDRAAEERQLSAARVNCEKYGFSPATDAFAGCVQTEINQAKLRAAAAQVPQPAAQSGSTIDPPPQPAFPTTTTTSCRRTLLGTIECTTR